VPRHPSFLLKTKITILDNSPSLFLSLSLPLSLTGDEGVRTLFIGQREREIERKRERDKEGGRKKAESVACSKRSSFSQSDSMCDYYINILNKLERFSPSSLSNHA